MSIRKVRICCMATGWLIRCPSRRDDAVSCDLRIDYEAWGVSVQTELMRWPILPPPLVKVNNAIDTASFQIMLLHNTRAQHNSKWQQACCEKY